MKTTNFATISIGALAVLLLAGVSLLVHPLLGLITARGIHVTYRDDLGLQAQETSQQALGLLAHADETHRQPRVGLGIRRPDPRRQEGGNDQRRRSGTLQQRSPRDTHVFPFRY